MVLLAFPPPAEQQLEDEQEVAITHGPRVGLGLTHKNYPVVLATGRQLHTVWRTLKEQDTHLPGAGAEEEEEEEEAACHRKPPRADPSLPQ